MSKKLLVGSSVLIASLASLVLGYSIGIKSANPKQMVTLLGGFMRPSTTIYITPDLLDPDSQWKRINPKLISIGDLNEDGIDDFLVQSDKFDYLNLEDLIYIGQNNRYIPLSQTKLNKREIILRASNYCKTINYDLKSSKFIIGLNK